MHNSFKKKASAHTFCFHSQFNTPTFFSTLRQQTSRKRCRNANTQSAKLNTVIPSTLIFSRCISQTHLQHVYIYINNWMHTYKTTTRGEINNMFTIGKLQNMVIITVVFRTFFFTVITTQRVKRHDRLQQQKVGRNVKNSSLFVVPIGNSTLVLE